MSIFLSQVFALYLLVTGLAMFSNPKGFHRALQELIASPALMLLSGVISLMIGSLLVLVHSYVYLDWRLLVTLVSWMTFVRGVLRLLAPEFSLRLAQKFSSAKRCRTAGIVSIALGAVFAYFGFFWI